MECTHYVILVIERNAALQLFGGLVPRMLGQKKVRNEESVCNVMTINEFFARYPSLQNFLLCQMSQHTTGLVHPSLVPLLVLFSRISLGVLKNSKERNGYISKFRATFKRTFLSPVVNVRKLATKAYANFTKKEEIIQEIKYFVEEIFPVLDEKSSKNTNYVDACLCCIYHLMKVFQNEHMDEFLKNQTAIEEIVTELAKKLSEINCYILRLNALRICNEIDLKITTNYINNQNLLPTYQGTIHPGFRDLTLEFSNLDVTNSSLLDEYKFDSRESCRKYLKNIERSSAKGSGNLCKYVQKFLEGTIDSSIISGKMIEQCNAILLQHDCVILEDSEVAMDILDLIHSRQAVTMGKLGVIAKTTSLMVQAVCFSSMMTKSDYKMFFGDESIYCSKFSEMSEEIERVSRANNMETCRIHAAQSLNYLLPVFNLRNLKVDFDALMVYAFVKLLNIGLVLMFDEDNHVRELVTIFASKLNTSIKYPSNVSTVLAIEKLVFYGLEQFSSCLEWFLPVSDVFLRPWSINTTSKHCSEDPLQILQKIGIREYLFESGDGINVYVEEAGNNMCFTAIVRRWLITQKSNLPSFRINVNIETILGQVNSVLKYVNSSSSEKGGFSSALWTNQGFLMIIRYYNLLLLIKEFPSIIGPNTNIIEEKQNSRLIDTILDIENHIGILCRK